MQLALERAFIDKPLNVDTGLIQLSSILLCSPRACKGVFNPNVVIFQSNCAEGLHFFILQVELFFSLY